MNVMELNTLNGKKNKQTKKTEIESESENNYSF